MTKYYKYSFLILFIISVNLLKAQSITNIGNNAFINISNNAYFVIDNDNVGALITSGTGGNIISEGENNVLKWNISTATGTLTIPWTTLSGVKIPLSINKTTAGTGSGDFILSTWETATDMNTPWPTAVTNMNLPSTVDGSLFVADRYWHIDALSYTTKPDITMIINYNPAANEIGGTNTITEFNLLAQRFNTALGHWEAYKLFGTNDAALDRVTSIVVPSADFFENWILVDNLNPLPIELVSFEANCVRGENEVEWTTQTEINNDYFVVEKSFDAVTFFELTKVQGAGNSNVINYYSVKDPEPSSGVIYYRLKQVDFEGATTYYKIVSSNCNTSGFDVNQILLNNNTLNFNITATEKERIIIYLYDYRGRMISNKAVMVSKGNNTIKLSSLDIRSGIYMLSIIGEFNNYTAKLMNSRN